MKTLFGLKSDGVFEFKNKIFFKLYLGYWFSFFLVLVLMVLSDALFQTGPHSKNRHRPVDMIFMSIGPSLAEVYENGDLVFFEKYLKELEKTNRMNLFLYDSNRMALTHRPIAENIDDLFGKVDVSGQSAIHMENNEKILVYPVRTKASDYYLVSVSNSGMSLPMGGLGVGPIGSPGGGPGGGPPGGPEGRHKIPPFFFRPLFISALVSGAICYWLSRYFTGPIVRLNAAVQQFTAGNLSVRVSLKDATRDDEISGLAFAFNRMADRIEALISSQKNILRDVSHELRSPLARINVAVELCRKSKAENVDRPLDRIMKETGRLDKLIGQILTLNTLESEMSYKEKLRFAVAPMIQKIVEDADFEANGMLRSVRLLENENCVLFGNEELLQSAIDNVLRNAVTHTQADTTVDVSCTITREHRMRTLMISVRDHGTGIPEDEIPHLFEPFYWLGKNARDLSSGAGIGLSITKAAVQFHGGIINARNAEDGGLIVEIRIPVIS